MPDREARAAATDRFGAKDVLRKHLDTLALGGNHPLMVVVPRDALERVLAEREVYGRGGTIFELPDEWRAT